MVDRLTGCQNQVQLLEQVNKELDEELHKAIQKTTAQGIIISTHEVSIGQQTIQIKKLENKIDQLVGRKEYIATNVSDIYREKYPSVFQPVPYPYTHPIRAVPMYARVNK